MILLFAASKGKETFISIAISVVLILSIPSVIFSYLFTSNVSERASVTLCSLSHHQRTDREFFKCSLVEKNLNTKYLQKLPEEESWWNLLDYYNMLLCIFYFSICVLQIISIINLQLLLSEYRELEREDNSTHGKSIILVLVTSFAN